MKKKNESDVRDPRTGQSWLYSEVVKDHFFNPRNLLKPGEEKKEKWDGIGIVGSPACGDEMKVWIKVEGGKIIECKWRTYGCASAIAATSMMSVMVTEKGGMAIDEALKLTPKQIMDRLLGLPTRKIHCSVLGDQALKSAIADFKSKQRTVDSEQ